MQAPTFFVKNNISPIHAGSSTCLHIIFPIHAAEALMDSVERSHTRGPCSKIEIPMSDSEGKRKETSSAKIPPGSLPAPSADRAPIASTIRTQAVQMPLEMFARDSIIAWFKGEFAAANAIIDALCNHLTQLDGFAGQGAEYESFLLQFLAGN
ncbi:hypothetical protein NE237_017079 [Protea cynaroides]|uniref:Uncharacterized protein n=1 Tax=Protea cynaroides TaxID=273540 RepID=A0A9Q0QME2_9MAGN|nr:hypothetical protein NE237_017079 [Protea cynaroides]